MAEIATMITAVAVLLVAVGAFLVMVGVLGLLVRFGNAIEVIVESYRRESGDGTSSRT